jgi:hypothetical protein
MVENAQTLIRYLLLTNSSFLPTSFLRLLEIDRNYPILGRSYRLSHIIVRCYLRLEVAEEN